jgi:hypothetical protein
MFCVSLIVWSRRQQVDYAILQNLGLRPFTALATAHKCFRSSVSWRCASGPPTARVLSGNELGLRHRRFFTAKVASGNPPVSSGKPPRAGKAKAMVDCEHCPVSMSSLPFRRPRSAAVWSVQRVQMSAG